MKRPSRKQRFINLRDAILNHEERMISNLYGTKALNCGPFRIIYSRPDETSVYQLEIWPGGHEYLGRVVYGDKVANVHWFDNGEVHITSYRSGGWENELLALLNMEGDHATD